MISSELNYDHTHACRFIQHPVPNEWIPVILDNAALFTHSPQGCSTETSPASWNAWSHAPLSHLYNATAERSPKTAGSPRSSIPAVAHFHELGLDPSTAAPHSVLHLRLHAQHLILRHALLPLHLWIRAHPVRGPGHVAFTGVGVREVRVLGAREHTVVPALHHHESGLSNRQ